jgi:hypothetical protein
MTKLLLEIVTLLVIVLLLIQLVITPIEDNSNLSSDELKAISIKFTILIIYTGHVPLTLNSGYKPPSTKDVTL